MSLPVKIESVDNDNYKKSFKTTSLFGGVQLYNIIISVVRSKFVALILGPLGMGYTGLYSSTLDFIASITEFGLGTSAVRDISIANAENNKKRISLVISVFRRLVWITGLVGLLVCVVLSPILSQLTFGSKDFAIGFIVLSCTLLFRQLTSGQFALLQGMRKYNYLAKANLAGSTLGLLVTIPLYYIWRIKAIVPVLVITAIVSFILSCYYSRKVGSYHEKVKFQDIKKEGKCMLTMGFFLSLSSILSFAVSYIVRIYVNYKGNVTDVGYFSAGFSIVNAYVGLVFIAMGQDYFPKLSGANRDEEDIFNHLVNDQIHISLVLLAPIIAAFLIFIRFVIVILYSKQFLPIEAMLYFSIFAIIFKAPSWALGFIFLAKGDSKIFFVNETVSLVYNLFFNIICYDVWGLTGLGISYLFLYFVYLCQNIIVCHYKYNFRFESSVSKMFFKQFLVLSMCFCLVVYAPSSIRYIVGSALVLVSSLYSYRLLNEKMNLTAYIRNKIKF
jgi:O-antigen/teichoic acid export membrane protein